MTLKTIVCSTNSEVLFIFVNISYKKVMFIAKNQKVKAYFKFGQTFSLKPYSTIIIMYE